MAVIECPYCGAPVHIEDQSMVRSGHSAASGRPRECVMREGRAVVHRCPEVAA